MELKISFLFVLDKVTHIYRTAHSIMAEDPRLWECQVYKKLWRVHLDYLAVGLCDTK